MKYYYFVSYRFMSNPNNQQPGFGNGEICRHRKISSIKDISEITAILLAESHKTDPTIHDLCIMNFKLLRKSIK